MSVYYVFNVTYIYVWLLYLSFSEVVVNTIQQSSDRPRTRIYGGHNSDSS